MIWKIWFYISLIFLFGMNLYDYINQANIDISSEYSYIFGIILVVCQMCLMGILYSLGWKKRMFSDKMLKAIEILFGLTLLIYMAVPLYSGYVQFSATEGIKPITFVLNILILILSLLVIALPFILLGFIGIEKYRKYQNEFSPVNMPYIKLALCPILTSFLASFVGILFFKTNNIPLYNFGDFIFELSFIYIGLFSIGYAFQKKIFNKLFWIISGSLVTLLLLISWFSFSEQYLFDIMFYQTGHLLSFKITVLSVVGFLFYIFYNYVFSDKIFPKNK